MSLEQVVLEVARGLYDVVKPGLGARGSQRIVGTAHSGDYTYALDETAEAALERLVREAGDAHGLPLAYYSEDRGLVPVHADPAYVLVVDPIDGTRPAVCGFESCCVSVAAARMADLVTFADIESACLIELGTGRALIGSKGAPPYTLLDKSSSQPLPPLSCRDTFDGMFWAHEVCGRPSQATHVVLGQLIDQSSHAGGCFVFNSSSYAISRVLTGQLDSYIDFYGALLPGPRAAHWRAQSHSLFQGRLFALFPYDIAAAAFLAQQAGAFVSDARGRSLDTLNLLVSGGTGLLSIVVAGNSALGAKLVEYLQHHLSELEK